MTKHNFIPSTDGLYWLITPQLAKPLPVVIDHDRYGASFKCFNGRLQGELGSDEYLLGPQPEPEVVDLHQGARASSLTLRGISWNSIERLRCRLLAAEA